MPKSKIDPSLLGIAPGDPRAAAKARERAWSACERCGGLHHSFAAQADGRVTQGLGCAASVSADGAGARGHYSSYFDDVVFAVEPSVRAELKGLDPLCDVCIAELVLAGGLFPVEWWTEGYHPRDPPMPDGPGAQTQARQDIEASLRAMIAEHGRPAS